MTTLQDLRKAKFSTIKAFASAWGYSTSKASYLLRGKYHWTLSKEEVQCLADVFEVSFDEVVEAANGTFEEGREFFPVREWKLKDRWEHQERIYEEVRRWKERGTGRIYTIAMPWEYDALGSLGLSRGATEDEIKRAFREKVKAMSDGKGGYVGDMDDLVQAKEKALAYLQGQRV